MKRPRIPEFVHTRVHRPRPPWPWMLLLILAVGVPAVAAERYRATAQVDRLARTYAPQITALAQRHEYRQAIAKAADYEQELLSLYPSPRYEMGLFQSEANHIQFHCPFTGWKPAKFAEEEAEVFQKLKMAGFEALLALEGASDQQRLTVFGINASRLTQRTGLNQAEFNLSSDQGVQFVAQMVAGSFGTVKSHRFQTIGDHRVLCLELATPFMGPEIRMLLLPTDQQIFGFLLASPAGDNAENVKKLDELVMTASFDYQPEDAEAVAAERARSSRPSVESRLDCAQRLAARGEFNAAGEELTELRHLLYGRMPKPTVEGDLASCPAYGVTLRNPDPARWKLSCMSDGVFQGVVLEDRFSVNGEGILIGVVDQLVTFGPQVVSMMNNDEETRRQSLIDSGRGAAMMIGQIESERLVPIGGDMAYEGIIKPNMPGVKARIRCIGKGDYALMIFVLANASDFDAKAEEADQIVAQHAELSAAQEVTTLKTPSAW